MIAAIALVASVIIVAGYFRLSVQRKPRMFHWANAVGCVPIIIQNYQARVWAALLLTTFFGVIGWMGLYVSWSDARKAAKLKEQNNYWNHVSPGRFSTSKEPQVIPPSSLYDGEEAESWRGDHAHFAPIDKEIR